jgi:hypothetical protein
LIVAAVIVSEMKTRRQRLAEPQAELEHENQG